jgi:inner membrane protein
MATPIGHYLLGLSLAGMVATDKQRRREAPWWAALAWAPDLDLIPGLIVGELGRFHHGASHSLLAVLVMAVVATGAVGLRGQMSLQVLLLAFVLCASHLVLDYFTTDNGPPSGMPFLWPWSDRMFQSPWPLLPDVQHTSRPLISVHNTLLVAREIVIFAPLAALVLRTRHFAGPWEHVPAWLFALWFVAAASLSIVSLQ